MAQPRTRTFNLIDIDNKKLNNQSHEISSIYSSKALSSSLEDSYITSCSDDSLTSDNYEIKRNNHYIKRSKLNRNDDNITSLKRRVRKQQLRYDQNQETNFPLSSSTDLFLISCLQQPVTPCDYRTKKSSYVVPLPPLVTDSRVVRTRVHGIKLNMYNC